MSIKKSVHNININDIFRLPWEEAISVLNVQAYTDIKIEII